jgi:hypothetical protein
VFSGRKGKGGKENLDIESKKYKRAGITGGWNECQ